MVHSLARSRRPHRFGPLITSCSTAHRLKQAPLTYDEASWFKHFGVRAYLEHSSVSRSRTKTRLIIYMKSPIRITGYNQGGFFFPVHILFFSKAPKEEWTDGQRRVVTGWHHRPRRKEEEEEEEAQTAEKQEHRPPH